MMKAKFARPSPPTARRFAARPRDRPGGEGLAARLCFIPAASTCGVKKWGGGDAICAWALGIVLACPSDVLSEH